MVVINSNGDEVLASPWSWTPPGLLPEATGARGLLRVVCGQGRSEPRAGICQAGVSVLRDQRNIHMALALRRALGTQE